MQSLFPCGKHCSPNSHSYPFLFFLTLFLCHFESGGAFVFVFLSPMNLLTAGVTVVRIFADALMLTQQMVRSMLG